MKPTDAAWAAGIVDGEGCIGIYRVVQTGYPGRFAYRVTVTVGNTDPRMLERLRAVFGGSLYTAKRSETGRKPMWQWLVINADAVAMLKAIRPYLVVKGDQADVALRYRPGRRGRRVSEAELASRDALVVEIAAMKREVHLAG